MFASKAQYHPSIRYNLVKLFFIQILAYSVHFLTSTFKQKMELVSWNELRLRKQLCDGVIRTADGSSFPIHRVIVSSFSPYFRVYFTNSLHEGQPEYTEMNLLDVPAYIVSMIVEFAYTRRCQVTPLNTSICQRKRPISFLGDWL